MHIHFRKLLLLSALLLAGAAVAWNPEYAWHDPAAPTASASAKPGGGGLYGTGSHHEGGIQCAHCHSPALAITPALDVALNFSPALASGHYAPSTRYTITVNLLHEVSLWPDAGTKDNNFAGMFEDDTGTPVGVLESDWGQIQSSCPAVVPASFPPSSTTLLYGDCHGILSRSTGTLNHWTFYWTSPAASAGTVHFFYGAVDGNGNDRSRGQDGGGDDAVKMGSLTLLP